MVIVVGKVNGMLKRGYVVERASLRMFPLHLFLVYCSAIWSTSSSKARRRSISRTRFSTSFWSSLMAPSGDLSPHRSLILSRFMVQPSRARRRSRSPTDGVSQWPRSWPRRGPSLGERTGDVSPVASTGAKSQAGGPGGDARRSEARAPIPYWTPRDRQSTRSSLALAVSTLGHLAAYFVSSSPPIHKNCQLSGELHGFRSRARLS